VKTITATVLAAALSAVAFPQSAGAGGNQLTARDKMALDATRALYGNGLRIKRTKRAVTIAPGSLTQAKWDRYVKEFYLPALQRVSVSRTGVVFRWARGYKDARWDVRGQVKRAHILMEPWLKFALCERLVASIGFKPNMTAYEKRKGWCAEQAIHEAFKPIYEYRGKKVTYKQSRERGNLKLDEVIFAPDASGHYPIVITVAGSREMVSRPGVKIATALSAKVDADLTPKWHRKVHGYWKRMLARYHEIERTMMKKQKRLARGKVAFSAEPFRDWLVRKPAKGTISCDKVYTLAYSPARKRSHGYHLSFVVDGVECKALPLDANERDNSDFHYSNSCSKMLTKGKVHKLEVNMHNDIVTGSHKRIELDKRDNRLKSRTYNLTKRGKKLYGASIKCK
jgi:hypothetical protein